MAERENDSVKNVFHIENLKFGTVSGVLEVESFTPCEVSLKITQGNISVRGSGLEVKSFNVETGDLTFAGEITSISLGTKKTSMWERLTK